ncbi:hypothetical protein ACQPWY_18615 [Pseudonocardia xinjiangensis]|uniref:hypothetical protein n=1 Tax=Pseudonocardia xinjiangensis TaxID=75289 RepID=UPI003D906C3B
MEGEHLVDGLTGLVAQLIAGLRGLVPPDVCPGGWPWAVSALGVAVGLLPTAGLVVVAGLRRRIGSRYGFGESTLLVGTGLLAAGLLPLLAFAATGEVFRLAAAGSDVPGLSGAELDDLGSAVCVAGPQSSYLGGYSVASAFDVSRPVEFGLAVVLLAGFPVVAAMFVAVQARLALRRGPTWPSKFFWLPVLALVFLTADTPAGASGHLWLGFTAGSFLGIFVVLIAGVPSRETVRRSLAPPVPRPAPDARPAVAGRAPSMQSVSSARSARSAPSAVADAPARPKLSDRLAERFAAREAAPPVVPVPRSAPLDRGPQAPLDRGPQAPVGPPAWWVPRRPRSSAPRCPSHRRSPVPAVRPPHPGSGSSAGSARVGSAGCGSPRTPGSAIPWR